MIISAMEAEQTHLLRTAEAMAAAARTAPKTKGVDFVQTAIVIGEEKEALAEAMERLGQESGAPFFTRDAGCVRAAGAVLLLGIGRHPRGFEGMCNYCGLGGCGKCRQLGAACAFDSVDLGIALGSAASIAADNRVDSRIMLSAGLGAKSCGFLPEGTEIQYGIPLSVSRKNPFFDR